MPAIVFFPFSPLSSLPQWPFVVVVTWSKSAPSTWSVAAVNYCDWYIPDWGWHWGRVLDFRILIIFLYISVLLHVVVTDNMHHYKVRSQTAETKGTVIAISEVKMLLPWCQLTLKWTEGLTWLRGSTQHPDGGGAGSPRGTWRGEEVLLFTLVGPGILSSV